MDDLRLSIAGLAITVVTRDRDLADVVRDRYKGFLSTGADDWRVEIAVQRAVASRPDGELRVARDGASASFSVSRPDFAATVDLGARCARMTLTDANEYSLDSFVRILYSLALVDAGGLILHAASLVRDGRAYIFCGPSGSGKTTVAQLSPDATLLSDELSIVRTTNAGPRAFGTPFWGELARAGEDQAVPIAGIYFLRQGPRHAAAAVRPKDALQRLLPNVLFFARDATLTASVLRIAATLTDAVPCFDLEFRRDPGFWEVVLHD